MLFFPIYTTQRCFLLQSLKNAPHPMSQSCLWLSRLNPSAIRHPWLTLGATSMSQPRFAEDAKRNFPCARRRAVSIGTLPKLVVSTFGHFLYVIASVAKQSSFTTNYMNTMDYRNEKKLCISTYYALASGATA